MEYWIVVIVNLIIGCILALNNVLVAIPIVAIGLTLGLVLIIFNNLRR